MATADQKAAALTAAQDLLDAAGQLVVSDVDLQAELDSVNSLVDSLEAGIDIALSSAKDESLTPEERLDLIIKTLEPQT